MLYEFNYLMFGGAAKNPEEREQLLLKEAFFHTPGEPRSARFQTSDVEMVRDLAVAGWTGRGLPDSMAIRHRTLVESHLVQYTSPNEGEVCDQLYVLEFQGPHLQYLKFGITADLITRVNVHCEEGHRNGLALLNGWASPRSHQDGTLRS